MSWGIRVEKSSVKGFVNDITAISFRFIEWIRITKHIRVSSKISNWKEMWLVYVLSSPVFGLGSVTFPH